jgi:hypothetical protein
MSSAALCSPRINQGSWRWRLRFSIEVSHRRRSNAQALERAQPSEKFRLGFELSPSRFRGRTQEREIYARLDTASPSCDCDVHDFKLTRLIAASLTRVVLDGDYRLACIKFRFLSSSQTRREGRFSATQDLARTLAYFISPFVKRPQIKRSRTRLQLVLRQNWCWRPAAFWSRSSVPHDAPSHCHPRGDGAPYRT